MDKSIGSLEDMYNATDKSWYINRYKLLDSDHYQPFWISGSISYDFVEESRRQKQIKENQRRVQNGESLIPDNDLRKAWYGPLISSGMILGDYVLSGGLNYNVYSKTYEYLTFGLGFPQMGPLTIGLVHHIEKTAVYNAETEEQTYSLTKVSSLNIDAGWTDELSSKIKISQKKVEGSATDRYESKIGLQYLDGSGCWGLTFLRSKSFVQNEEDADYVMQLNIIFMGNTRPVDFSTVVEKELPRSDSRE